MGVRYPSSATAARLTNTIVTTTETLILTTPPLNLSLDFAQVLLFWYAIVTIGTGGTSIATNLRRGTLVTSPLVNISTGPSVSAGSTVVLSGCYPDSPGAIGAQQYSLSLVVTLASANSTVIDGALLAVSL